MKTNAKLEPNHDDNYPSRLSFSTLFVALISNHATPLVSAQPASFVWVGVLVVAVPRDSHSMEADVDDPTTTTTSTTRRRQRGPAIRDIT